MSTKNTMTNKNRNKRFHILIAVAILLLLYICYIQMDRREISDIHFIQMFCIDKTDDGFMVSALYNDGGSENSDAWQYIDGECDSVYTAFEELKRKDSKELTITHTSYFILSTSAATYGLPECLDFISRDETVKTNASVFILQSNNGNKVINDAMDDDGFLPQETLTAITQKQTKSMKKVDNTLMTVLNNMNNQYNNLLIPYLVYNNGNMYIEGYATFKDSSLYSYLDYETSQTIDLFRNRLRTYPLTLSDGLTVDLTDFKVNQDVDIVNNTIQLTMNLSVNSELKEVAAGNFNFTEDTLTEIKEAEQIKLREQFQTIISLMKKEQIDVLDIGTYLTNESSAFENSSTKEINSYLENMLYTLNIQSTIAKNYIITK